MNNSIRSVNNLHSNFFGTTGQLKVNSVVEGLRLSNWRQSGARPSGTATRRSGNSRGRPSTSRPTATRWRCWEPWAAAPNRDIWSSCFPESSSRKWTSHQPKLGPSSNPWLLIRPDVPWPSISCWNTGSSSVSSQSRHFITQTTVSETIEIIWMTMMNLFQFYKPIAEIQTVGGRHQVFENDTRFWTSRPNFNCNPNQIHSIFSLPGEGAAEGSHAGRQIARDFGSYPRQYQMERRHTSPKRTWLNVYLLLSYRCWVCKL